MACVIRARKGRLFYRVFWDGYQTQERTGLRDTPGNRERMQRKADAMTDDIAERRFDYLRWFPKGSKASLFGAAAATPTPSTITVRKYATQVWLPRLKPPLARTTTAKTYRKNLLLHVLPVFGARRFQDVTLTALQDFRTRLVTREADGGKGLAMKTARDIMDAAFRALYRDARCEGLAVGDPFADLKWPDKITPEPDPFTAEERDVLCAYFADRDPFWYPFVYLRFWTGVRPSEVRGLRRCDWNPREGKLRIRISRTEGEDNAPKTPKSRRTIKVLPGVRRVLLARPAPLAPAPDDFLFTTPTGLPLD